MSHSNYRSVFSSRQFKTSLFSLCLVGVSLVATGGESLREKSLRSTDLSPYTSASRVYIDPNSGALRGSPFDTLNAGLQLTPELQNSISRSTVGLVIENGAGGGKMVRLQGRFRHLSAATANGDSVRCFDGSGVSEVSGVSDLTEGTVK